ncbi:hypothetical protein DK26_01560 [Bosea sp. WAO]|nr:hypothetical protein DK26_01560 [Bosea sp. WAO]
MMKNYRNPLRQKLAQGKTAFGLWVTLATATMTELAIEAGLDWVCIDMEHGATDYRDIVEHARAARGSDLAVLVRVPSIAIDSIKRCLDLGADGIVVPLVRSARDVEAALDFARYPLAGKRGLGGERAQRWGLRVEEYIATANDEIMVIPMIETADAAAAIDEIFAVPGLDFAFVGPGDLSASLGHIGSWEGPGVAETIAQIVASAGAANITLGTYGVGPNDIRSRCEQGFRFLAIGSDAAMLANRIGSELSSIRNLMPALGRQIA